VVSLAETGPKVTHLQRALTRRERKHLKLTNAGDFFLADDKKSPAVGHRLAQPILARTLDRLAKRGTEDFYTGGIASAIHRDMVRNGGLIRKDDLAQIPWPIERRPLTGQFNSARFFTMPPPGAGRTLIEMLNILSHLRPAQYDPDTPAGLACFAEVIRRAFVDRRDRPFDPNFYPQVEERKMIDPDYARLVARKVRRKIRTRGETTHLSVMDRHGNTVALTQSIENVFGACVVNPELGFLYNNYMNAFEYKDYSHPYFLRPGAVPWASVAPTIMFQGRSPWLVIGSPGSERIAPSIAQVLVRMAKGYSLYEAIDAPRIHCTLDGKVSLEADRVDPNVIPHLERHGFTVDPREPYAFYLGCVQAVERTAGVFHGAADPRRDGSAGGPRS
jgi:gamma-glutamyltranspeptidase/glutathione hydrolase